jgi:SnoaL-like domain
MELQGKGMMIWILSRCENGDPEAIAKTAQAAGLTHVLIKIANGTRTFNVDSDTGIDLVAPVVQSLKARGIAAWGWHYVYGDAPKTEANIAIQRVRELNLDGYLIDAEGEYKDPGKDDAAAEFMTRIKAGLPSSTPVGLSSYRWPTYHPQFPWKEFLEKCDVNMPQVYWVKAHNPADQLARSLREFQALTPYRPLIPTGPMYIYGSWEPTAQEIVEFLDKTRALNLEAANFFAWYYARSILKPLWSALSTYPWQPYPSLPDFPQRYIDALNTRDVNKVMALYAPTATHITPARTVQGEAAIRSWYSAFFSQVLPNATFSLQDYSGSGTSWQFSWSASASNGSVSDGKDTLGILDGEITYHYSQFTVK